MTMTKRELELSFILHTLRSQAESIKNEYSIEIIGVFGSVARGDSKSSSDIDILIGYEAPPTLFMLAKLEDHLTTLLESKVDIVSEYSLRDFVRQSIMKDVIIL